MTENGITHRGTNDFVIMAGPNRGGVDLVCSRDGCSWHLLWPAHCDAPRLMSLIMQANIHERDAHGK